LKKLLAICYGLIDQKSDPYGLWARLKAKLPGRFVCGRREGRPEVGSLVG